MTKNLLRLFTLESYVLKPRLYLLQPLTKLSNTITPVVKKPISEGPIYKKADHEYKVSKKSMVQTLETILNIKTFDAVEIVLNNPHFKNVSKSLLKANYTLYLDNGISRETLLQYPELLTVVDSESKLKQIKKLDYNINEVCILLLMTYTNLVKFVYSELGGQKNDGKITTLSSFLQISIQKTCECLAQKPFLLNLPKEKLENNIKTLIEYGITTEDICKDLWVLRYSEELIRARLDVVKGHKIETVKTWMVRVQEKAFQTHLQRRSDTKLILGDNSLNDYLSERLECSPTFASYIILKQPALKNRSLKKLKELIDFLYAEGFTSQHICRVPKILVHSVETTRKRLKLLQENGIQIDGLSLLTKSQNQFTQHYEALVKNKNKAKSKT